jgi:hypothetical protein
LLLLLLTSTTLPNRRLVPGHGMVQQRHPTTAIQPTIMKDVQKIICFFGGAVLLSASGSEAFTARTNLRGIRSLRWRHVMMTGPSTLLNPGKMQPEFLCLTPGSTEPSSFEERNKLFRLLETGRDQKPNRGNFFYNDEVSSHLYGYMYLVGFFAAQDPLFLGAFLVLSGLAAWATQEDLLPANPRVPAMIAVATFAATISCRYVVGLEVSMEDMLGEVYQGPTDYALAFEFGISTLNVLWGLFGTWQTKEQRDGATYGF